MMTKTRKPTSVNENESATRNEDGLSVKLKRNTSMTRISISLAKHILNTSDKLLHRYDSLAKSICGCRLM